MTIFVRPNVGTQKKRKMEQQKLFEAEREDYKKAAEELSMLNWELVELRHKIIRAKLRLREVEEAYKNVVMKEGEEMREKESKPFSSKKR